MSVQDMGPTIRDLRDENEKLRKELAAEKEKVERLEYEHNSAFTMAAERAVRISELQRELADERAHAVYLTAFAQEQIAAREESADHVKSMEEALRSVDPWEIFDHRWRCMFCKKVQSTVTGSEHEPNCIWHALELSTPKENLTDQPPESAPGETPASPRP